MAVSPSVYVSNRAMPAMAYRTTSTKHVCAMFLLCVFLSSFYTCASGQSVSPATVSDAAGNSADINSTVTWGSIPSGATYKTSTVYNDGGLKPMYDFAKSFLSTVWGSPDIAGLVETILAGTINLSGFDAILNLAKPFIGVIVCVAIGIAFLLLMPLIGFCFCCCRCCNNCGGKMEQKYSSNAGCKRMVFGVILFILTIFIIVGMACTFLTNDRVAQSVTDTATNLDNNLADVDTFMSQTLAQINHVTSTNFKFLKQVIFRDFDNIGVLVGIPVRTAIATTGGANAAINSILSMQNNVNSVSASMFAVNDSLANFKSKADALASRLSTIKTAVDATKAEASCSSGCSALDTSKLALDANSGSLPNINSEMDKMKEVTDRNLTALALQGQAQFNDIPATVTNESQATINSLKTQVHNFSQIIDSMVSKVMSLPNMVTNMTTSIRKDVKTYSDIVTPFDKYRWYGGIGLCSIILLIAVLQLLGLVFGVCGHDKEALPTERGCLSNSGGEMLMSSVGFIFLFSALFMLLTMVCFIIGIIFEKGLCEPITDPDFKLIKSVLDKPNTKISPDGYLLGKMLLQNGSIPLTISGIFTGCKNGGASFSVMKLDQIFDLNTVVNYKSKIDINGAINGMNVGLSSIKILSSTTETQLNDFRDSMNIDFNAFKTELAKNNTQVGLDSFASSLDSLAASNSDPAKTQLTNEANDVRSAKSNEYAAMETAKAYLLANITALEAAVSGLPTSINNTLDAAKAVDTYLANNGSQMVKTEALKYANRIIATADSYVAHTLNAINNDIGKCKPLYNVWYSITSILLCSYFVDIVNGFWFSLGWCVFFMTPSIIFSVKLAKHYRRMKYMVGYDDTDAVPMDEYQHLENGKRKGEKNLRQNDSSGWVHNKVRPSHNAPPPTQQQQVRYPAENRLYPALPASDNLYDV